LNGTFKKSLESSEEEYEIYEEESEGSEIEVDVDEEEEESSEPSDSIGLVVSKIEKKEKLMRQRLYIEDDDKGTVAEYKTTPSCGFKIPRSLFDCIPRSITTLLRELITNNNKLSEYTDFYYRESTTWSTHPFYMKLFKQIVCTVYTTTFGDDIKIEEMPLLRDIMDGKIIVNKLVVDHSTDTPKTCSFCKRDHTEPLKYRSSYKPNIQSLLSIEPTLADDYILGYECSKRIKLLSKIYNTLHSISMLPQTEFFVLSTYSYIQEVSRKILKLCNQSTL